MPTFFFHLREPNAFVHDDEGLHLPDAEAARALAVREAREMAGADAKTGRLCLACAIEVADEAGHLVCSVSFADVVDVRAG